MRYWWLVRYCAAHLKKTVNSIAPSITNLLVRSKQVSVTLLVNCTKFFQVIVGMKTGVEITISKPSTPSEIVNAVFSGCRHDEDAIATVFQQELIIACSDLIVQNAHAFDGVLTIRLEWLTNALQLLLDYVKVLDLKPSELGTILNCSCPISVVKLLSKMKTISVYDLPPTMVKDILYMLMTKKNWHLL